MSTRLQLTRVPRLRRAFPGDGTGVPFNESCLSFSCTRLIYLGVGGSVGFGLIIILVRCSRRESFSFQDTRLRFTV